MMFSGCCRVSFRFLIFSVLDVFCICESMMVFWLILVRFVGVGSVFRLEGIVRLVVL